MHGCEWMDSSSHPSLASPEISPLKMGVASPDNMHAMHGHIAVACSNRINERLPTRMLPCHP